MVYYWIGEGNEHEVPSRPNVEMLFTHAERTIIFCWKHAKLLVAMLNVRLVKVDPNKKTLVRHPSRL